MNNVFKGTGVAIVTPFHKHGTVDFSSLENLVEHIIKGKASYIVVLGTTGEAVTLSKEEKLAVSSHIVEVVNNRLPLVLGVGSNNTQEVINTFHHSTLIESFQAIMSVTPCYNKPQQKGLYYHYKNISATCPLPIIMYNVPGRTSVNMTAETTLKIAQEFPNIIGIKEASGNMAQVMSIIKNKPDNFLVISGDDLLALPIIAAGGDGVISVAANAFPDIVSQMVNFALDKNLEKAVPLHYKMLDFVNAIFEQGNPSGIKAALEILGLIQQYVRLPLVKVEKTLYNNIASIIETLNKK